MRRSARRAASLNCPKVVGLKFGSVAGEILQPQTPLLLLYELPYRTAAVTRQSIPNDQQFAGNVAQQMLEELDDLRTTDRSRKQAEVEVPPSHARDRRQRLPVKVVLQHRRLSAWCPGAAAVGTFAQSALVDEDDRAAFVFGLFFNSGQCFCFHRRIFSSSRSKARPVGFQ